MKTCTKCGEAKPEADFSRARAGRRHTYCKLCNNAGRSAWDALNPERKREQRLYERYRLRPEQLAAILAAQGGRCGVCGRVFSAETKYHIDHDRSCCPGRNSCGYCVRGVLCIGCNTKLGWFEPNRVGILEYLASPNPVTEITPPRRRASVAQK